MIQTDGQNGLVTSLSPDLSGAYAPVLTPFTKDGKLIDVESFHRHLTYLEQSGLTGVLLCGTNGEFDQLSIDERLQVVDAALSASTRLKIIAGATVPDSRDDTFGLVRKLSEYAPQITALLVSPPFYNVYAKGQSVPTNLVVEFYHDLVKLQDRLPLMLYNVPVLPKGDMTAPVTAEIVASLRDESIVIGIKDSTAKLENIDAYLEAKPGIQVLIGSDFIIRSGLERGAVGSITACGNIFPNSVLAVYKAQSRQEQLDAQTELTQLRELLDIYPTKKVAIQKKLLAYLGIVQRDSPVRDQSKELTLIEKEKITAALQKLIEGLSNISFWTG